MQLLPSYEESTAEEMVQKMVAVDMTVDDIRSEKVRRCDAKTEMAAEKVFADVALLYDQLALRFYNRMFAVIKERGGVTKWLHTLPAFIMDRIELKRTDVSEASDVEIISALYNSKVHPGEFAVMGVFHHTKNTVWALVQKFDGTAPIADLCARHAVTEYIINRQWPRTLLATLGARDFLKYMETVNAAELQPGYVCAEFPGLRPDMRLEPL